MNAGLFTSHPVLMRLYFTVTSSKTASAGDKITKGVGWSIRLPHMSRTTGSKVNSDAMNMKGERKREKARNKLDLHTCPKSKIEFCDSCHFLILDGDKVNS
jgi:hypothetical protein